MRRNSSSWGGCRVLPAYPAHLDAGDRAVLAPGGDFYGAARDSSTNRQGTVFKRAPAGTVTTLHVFSGGVAGDGPRTLLLGADGHLYGTTDFGGAQDCGTVFRLTLGGAFSVLHSFACEPDGTEPTVVQGRRQLLRHDPLRRTGGHRHGVSTDRRRRVQHATHVQRRCRRRVSGRRRHEKRCTRVRDDGRESVHSRHALRDRSDHGCVSENPRCRRGNLNGPPVRGSDNGLYLLAQHLVGPVCLQLPGALRRLQKFPHLWSRRRAHRPAALHSRLELFGRRRQTRSPSE